MDRASYIAASGGFLQHRKLEVQNNNLANLNTVGFKRQFITSETQNFANTFAAALGNRDPYARPDHDRNPGVESIRVHTDFSLGPVQRTGNPFHVALRNPKDFFVVNTPEGQLYTRAGDFTLSPDGNLVTQDGQQVLGDGGLITVTEAGAEISQDGSVRVRGEAVGRLQVARFNDPSLPEHAGGNRFRATAGAAPETVDAQLVTRSLEQSNVSPVSSMVDVMVTNRAFEAYTKAAQTIDQLNQAAITQVGRRQ